MRRYNKTDLSFYKIEEGRIGDINVDESGDLKLGENLYTIAQDIQNRMRTQRTDWYFHPNIGADLELAIGMHNSEETALWIKQSAYRTLTYDGLVDMGDVRVEVVPTAAKELEIFVFLNSDEKGIEHLVFNDMIKL